MNWKGCGRKRSWLNFMVLSRHLSGRTEKTTKNLHQDNRSPGPTFGWLVGHLIYNASSITWLYSVDDTVISEWWWMRKDLVERSRDLMALCRRSPGGTEKIHEKLNDHIREPDPRFEPGTSRMRSRAVNHSTTTFSDFTTARIWNY
jgi:hypothetical protein